MKTGLAFVAMMIVIHPGTAQTLKVHLADTTFSLDFSRSSSGDLTSPVPAMLSIGAVNDGRISSADSYVIELFPGQTFDGTRYSWVISGGPVSGKFEEVPEVNWLSLSRESFTSTGCTDPQLTRLHFTAPQTEGTYTTVLQDANGFWEDVNVSLNVTDTPTLGVEELNLTLEPGTYPLALTLQWTGVTAGCLGRFVPDSTESVAFSTYPDVAWLQHVPAQIDLALDQQQQINVVLSLPQPGTYQAYQIISREYLYAPLIIRWSINVPGTTPTPVEENTDLPARFALDQNYPNPFNPSTTIRFDLPASGPATLKVYDVLGREVATLVEGVQSAGAHEATFETGDLPSGVYLYRLEAGSFVQTRRMLLTK